MIPRAFTSQTIDGFALLRFEDEGCGATEPDISLVQQPYLRSNRVIHREGHCSGAVDNPR